jgi:hypothetical protein
MPVSVIVDDCNEREQVYILDPGNSRIKCLTTDGKFVEHLGKMIIIERILEKRFMSIIFIFSNRLPC